jgi:hypothetical protein
MRLLTTTTTLIHKERILCLELFWYAQVIIFYMGRD